MLFASARLTSGLPSIPDGAEEQARAITYYHFGDLLRPEHEDCSTEPEQLNHPVVEFRNYLSPPNHFPAQSTQLARGESPGFWFANNQASFDFIPAAYLPSNHFNYSPGKKECTPFNFNSAFLYNAHDTFNPTLFGEYFFKI
jgi:hypothetical protein